MATTFTLTSGVDTLTNAKSDGVDDEIVANLTSDLQSTDSIDAGTGYDWLEFFKAGTVADAQFTGVSNIEALWLAAKSGNFTLTLATEAEQSGLNWISASSNGGTVTIDAKGMTSGIGIDTGTGNNILSGGVGADTFYFSSAQLKSTDIVDGGGFGGGGGIFANYSVPTNDVISIYDKANLLDAALAGIKNVEQITVAEGYTPVDVIGQKIVLGTNSVKAGIITVENDYDYALTVDAGARSAGLNFWGATGDDVFVGSTGNDAFDAWIGNDSYRVKLASFDSNDWYDGGQGTDEIRILDSYDGKNAATKIVDADFAQVLDVERLVFNGTGKQDVTLSGAADDSGLAVIDASKVTGGLTVDATAMANALKVYASGGVDKIQLGGTGGGAQDENEVVIQSAKLTSADILDGGIADFRDLRFTDAVKLTDAYFAGKTGITHFTNLMFDNTAAGQSLVAGANFEAFVSNSGIGFVTATSSSTIATFTFDFSKYSGNFLSVEGGAGNDVFIAGSTNMQFLAAGPAWDKGDADSFRFASQYLDGLDTIDGGDGAKDEVVVLDDSIAVLDSDLAGIDNVEILRLAAAKTGSYTVTLDTVWKGSDFTTVDGSLAGVDLNVNAGTIDSDVTVLASGKTNAITTGSGDDTIAIDAKSFDASDKIAAGSGSDILKFTTGGVVLPAALAAVTGIEALQLSDAGNSVAVPAGLTPGNGQVDIDVNGATYDTFDFAVFGGKGGDTIDASAMSSKLYLGLVAGAGTDKITGSAGDNAIFFSQPGDLTGSDLVNGGAGYDWVVSGAGTYTSDQFKGFSNVEEFDIFDADTTKGSSITIKNDYYTHATPDSGASGSKGFMVWIDRSMTSDDKVDASAVTSSLNNLATFTGAGNDTIIGGAGSEWFRFDDDGGNAFTLNDGDTVNGGTNWDTIALTNNLATKVALSDADLAGVTSVQQLSIRDSGSGGDIDIELGANAAAGGIQQVRAYDYDSDTGPVTYFTGNLKLDASNYADGIFIDSGLQVYLGAGDDNLTLTAVSDQVRIRDNDLLTDDDVIKGGDGRDRLVFQGDTDVTDAQLKGVTEFEQIRLQGADITITLSTNADKAGIERVDASRVTSLTTHGATVDLHAMTNAVDIYGSNYADTIQASSGGGMIIGGAGADAIKGGNNTDIFAYMSLADSMQDPVGSPTASHMDVIEGFDAGDQVDLSLFGLDSQGINSLSNGAFVIDDDNTLFGSERVAIQYNGTNATRLYVDVNQDGKFELNQDLVVEFKGDVTGDMDVIFDGGPAYRLGSNFANSTEDAAIKLAAGTYLDNNAAFNTVGKDSVVLTSTAGNYSLTLGAAAEATGATTYDASAAGGSVVIDASGVHTGLNIIAGKAANTLTGTIADDVFVFTSAGLAGDKVNGGASKLDQDTLFISDKAALTDAAFAGVHDVEILEVGQWFAPADVVGQKVTLGTNSEKAGIAFVYNDYDIGLTVDASARKTGIEFDAWSGDDVLVAGSGNDGFDGQSGNDSLRIKLANFDDSDWYDGGLGTDEVRILDSYVVGKDETKITDDDFAGVTSVERLVFDGTGKQDVTLAASADNSGLQVIDGSKVAGGLSIDAILMSNDLKVYAGGGADKIQLGGTTENEVVFQSSKLTSADLVDGGGATFRDLRFSDAVKLTDAYFAGLKTNVTGFTNLMFDNTAAGQSLVAGANFADFISNSGISFVTATSSSTTATFTFDFSKYSGNYLSVEGGAGNDVFIAGETDMQFLAAGPAWDKGDGDSFRFASQYLDGLDLVDGGDGFKDEVVVLDDLVDVTDSGLTGITNVEILRLAAAKTGAYTVTLDTVWDASSFTTVDGAQAGVNLNVFAGTLNNVANVLASSKVNTIATGGGNDTISFDAKTFDKFDTVDAGTGSDLLKFTTAGVVAAAGLANVTGVEGVQLSDLGNSIVVPDALVQGGTDGIDVSVSGFVYDTFDFAVIGGKGADTIDASAVDPGTYLALVAGGGTGADNIKGSAGDDYIFFTQAGELTSADKVDGGDGFDELVVSAGNYTSDQFKGFKNVEELEVMDNEPTKGSTIVIKNDFLTTSGVEGWDSSKTFSIWFDRGNKANDVVDASAVTSALNNISVQTGFGDDKITGGAGNDYFSFIDDGNGNLALDSGDTVSGGLGWDVIALENRGSSGGIALVDANLAHVTGVESIRAVDDYNGNQYDVSVTLGELSEQAGVYQVDGEDMLGDLTVVASARSQDLQVVLGEGIDDVVLGGGDDTIDVREGSIFTTADVIKGGAGDDALRFETGATLVAGDLANVKSVETLRLDNDSFDLTLGTDADAAGIETINASRSTGAIVDASLMHNNLTIVGSNAIDVLRGGLGNDVIEGGGGADTLTGGAGADTFTYLAAGDSVATHGDVITDFAHATDTIDVTALGLATGIVNGGNVGAFGAGPGSSFDATHGVIVETDGTDSRIYLDVNKDGAFTATIDSVIQLDNNANVVGIMGAIDV